MILGMLGLCFDVVALRLRIWARTRRGVNQYTGRYGWTQGMRYRPPELV